MTNDQILSIFKQSNALLEGHFELTSGLHSPNYFQCAKVLQYPQYAEQLCREIAEHFQHSQITAVVSPALGGIVVGQEVGRQLSVRTMFAERKDGQMQLRRGFEITSGEKVLVCEDVITTGGSVQEVISIVQNMGGLVAGVGVIVDRSGGSAKFHNLFASMTMQVITYKPEACPLCAKGTPAVKPGSRSMTVK
jgi:orotate phosphoribosyltransferase